MRRGRHGLRLAGWIAALSLVTQFGCVALPEDFWVDKFGEIVNGAILSVFNPVAENLITDPISNALSGG